MWRNKTTRMESLSFMPVFFTLNFVLLFWGLRMCLKAEKGTDSRLSMAQPWHLGSSAWALLVQQALSGSRWSSQGCFRSTYAALSRTQSFRESRKTETILAPWNHLVVWSRHSTSKFWDEEERNLHPAPHIHTTQRSSAYPACAKPWGNAQ